MNTWSECSETIVTRAIWPDVEMTSLLSVLPLLSLFENTLWRVNIESVRACKMNYWTCMRLHCSMFFFFNIKFWLQHSAAKKIKINSNTSSIKLCQSSKTLWKWCVFQYMCMCTSVLSSSNNIMVGCLVCVPCPVVFPQIERGCTGGLWLWPCLSENNTLVKLGQGKK